MILSKRHSELLYMAFLNICVNYKNIKNYNKFELPVNLHNSLGGVNKHFLHILIQNVCLISFFFHETVFKK